MAERKRHTMNRVEQEHEDINKHVIKLKDFMMRESKPADFPKWRMELIWELRDFKNRLLKHFDLEEEGGFMTDILQVTPHAQHQVSELKKDHERISGELDLVVERIKALREQDARLLEQIRRQLTTIMTSLREHENEEHVLMQRAYFREYGHSA